MYLLCCAPLKLLANSVKLYLESSKAFLQRTIDEDEPQHPYKSRLKLVEDSMMKSMATGITFLSVGVSGCMGGGGGGLVPRWMVCS